MDYIFIIILKIVLLFEGGWFEAEQTYKGIMQIWYDSYRESYNLPLKSVRDISDYELNDFYYKRYYKASWCNEIPQTNDSCHDISLNLIHFDSAVNFGVTRSMKFLAQALDVDKIKNREHLRFLLKNKNLNQLTNKYVMIRIEFRYDIVKRKPEKIKYLKGWLKRDRLITRYF